MKKVILVALSVMAFAAQASNNANPCGNNGNNCTTGSTTNALVANGGTGGQGGAGGNGLAIAGASSAAEAKANAAAMAAQQQGQQQGQAQGQIANGGKATATGGNSGGNKIKTSTNVDIKGDIYERSAPAVIAAPIPTVATSCRLYMFGGGTNVNGAVSGSIPLGNDQTCLSGVNLNNMLRINQHVANTFSMQDMVKEACKVEGMDTAEPCKKK